MSDDTQAAFLRYQDFLIRYRTLNEQIDLLLVKHSGGPEQMNETELAQYREIAFQRDSILNEMRALEQVLFTDDESS